MKTLAQTRKRKRYWSDPERFRREALEYRLKNPEQYLERARLRRIANRDVLRARARLESLHLTDSYIRNKLSNRSHKRTMDWTDAEVRAKRLEILGHRLKRIDGFKAKDIRAMSSTKDRLEIAETFNVSPSLIWMILRNQIHHDPDWQPERRIKSWAKVTAFFKVSDEIGHLTLALEKLE